MSEPEKEKKDGDDKVRSEGDVFRTDFSTTLGELCPPINAALVIFGNDKLLWMIIISALHIAYYFLAPACLLFLLPYPTVYFFPMYASLVALQAPLEPNVRALWLSYWVVIVMVDISEMVLLGTLVQTLQYWPALKIVLSLWLICQTPNFDEPGKVDVKQRKKLEEEFRIKRKIMEIDGSSQAKIDKFKSERRIEIKDEIDKSRTRDKRYHAFMLVEPFLPQKTHAGGEDINFEMKKKRRSSQWPATEEDWIEFNKEKLDFFIERGMKGDDADPARRLGDWGRPVVEIDGEVVDHNPVVDDHGRMLDVHKHGKAGEVDYTNTWNDDEYLMGKDVAAAADRPGGRQPVRDKDGKRIRFVGNTDWMPLDTPNSETVDKGRWAYPGKHNEPSDAELQSKIDKGVWENRFAGSELAGTDDKPDKVLGLNSSNMPLHETAEWPAHTHIRNRWVNPVDLGPVDDDDF